MAIEDYYYPMERAATSNDGEGAAMGDYSQSVGEFAPFVGYIGKPSTKQAIVYAQRGIEIAGRLYAPVDAGVCPFDIIRETDEDTGEPTYYQVVSRPRDVARRGHHVECDVAYLKGGV